jgi:hypothetical protein
MRGNLVLFVIGWLALISSPGGQKGRCTDVPAPSDFLGAIRQDSETTLDLRATPVPEFSDDLIFLETGGSPAPSEEIRTFCFYLVTVAPYRFADNDKVETGSIVVDSNPQWLVAYDSQDSETYLLSGAKDPTAGFNRLIARLHLRVTSPALALDVFDSYLKMARGPDFRSRALGDDLKLESVALDFFRMHFPYPRSRSAFTAWWASISTTTKQSIKPPSAIALKNGFAVRFYFYDQGILWKQTTQIKIGGTVDEGKPEALTSPPPK